MQPKAVAPLSTGIWLLGLGNQAKGELLACVGS
jgi:hypothetical protein